MSAKASTHTEVYRPFTGTLGHPRVRFWPLYTANLRTACKRKLPLLLLLAPAAIATVICSFVVYTMFSLQSGHTPDALGGEQSAAGMLGNMMMTGMVKQMIQVRNTIVVFHTSMTIFGVLVMAWFGAGAIAEDRRLGAHLLYFTRPLSRLDYLIAKFLLVVTFGALVTILPSLVICAIAVLASPEWSFLDQEGWIIPRSILFGALNVTVIASLVLAVSSLASRKTYALAGFFGYFMLSGALSGLLRAVQRDNDWLVLSPVPVFGRIAHSMFEMRGRGPGLELAPACWAAATFFLVSWAILAWRVRRLEVVA
jgi:hypothetical protein